MSSYGLEIEISRPIYFLISRVMCDRKSNSTQINLEFNQNVHLQIGPTREEENSALCALIQIILEKINLADHRQFATIEQTIRDKTSSTRLNRSIVSFPWNEIPFEFAGNNPKEKQDIKFLINNIQFSIDHGLGDFASMIPELITFPVGRYPFYNEKIFKYQKWFLNLFFNFCDKLAHTDEYQIPCSIKWHDPTRWRENDQNSEPWDYELTLQGICILPSNYKEIRREVLPNWGRLYPQYNFGIDLTHFLLKEHHKPFIMPEEQDEDPNVQDPIAYLYDLSLRGLVKMQGSLNPIAYEATLLDISRKIVHEMSHLSASWESYKDISRYWIDGAFSFTIWYFLSLCLGERDNYLYKNMFLFMPKTSPIPFLKAAYQANPEYYDRLIVHFIPAFSTIVSKIFRKDYNNNIYPFCPDSSQYIKDRFLISLKMNRFFPRIAQWYNGLTSKIQLVPPALPTHDLCLAYSNPLPSQLPREIQELHDTILFFGGDALVSSDETIERKGVLSALMQVICISFMGPSTRYKLAITQHSAALTKAMTMIGRLLEAPAASRLPVNAQPGFGRPKLETRISDIPSQDERGTLINVLNALGRPRFVLPKAIEVQEAKFDQKSVDLSIALGDLPKTAQHHENDPWQTQDDQFVWIPGKQEFGRRKQEHVKQWLEKLPPQASIASSFPSPLPPTSSVIPTFSTNAVQSMSTLKIIQPTEEQLSRIMVHLIRLS